MTRRVIKKPTTSKIKIGMGEFNDQKTWSRV